MKVTLIDRADYIAMSIYSDQLIGERTIRPNNRGLFILAVLEAYIEEPYRMWRMKHCKHPNMVDESWANGDTGGDAGYCPDCGFSFSHTHY